MCKIKDAIIDGKYPVSNKKYLTSQELDAYFTAQLHEDIRRYNEEVAQEKAEMLRVAELNEKPQSVNWYGEMIAKNKARAEIEDMTDDWRERDTSIKEY